MDSKLNIYTPVRMHNVVVAIVVGVISDKLQRVRLHHTHTYTNQSCTTAFEGRSPCTHAYNIHTSQSTITTMFIECCAHINTSPAQKKIVIFTHDKRERHNLLHFAIHSDWPIGRIETIENSLHILISECGPMWQTSTEIKWANLENISIHFGAATRIDIEVIICWTSRCMTIECKA